MRNLYPDNRKQIVTILELNLTLSLLCVGATGTRKRQLRVWYNEALAIRLALQRDGVSVTLGPREVS